ncbi:hypothetical protein PQX77_009706 [Marasmius sp. AFHP31]|nr:hypothetical protein PQX77_009706 [Marasmius sp. AFHP31]
MSNGVVLRTAKPEDLVRLADIADAAFRSDSHTQLKSIASKPGAISFRDGMYGALQVWFAQPKIDLVVAENQNTHEVVGWIAWSRRGFAGDLDLPLSEINDTDTRATGTRTTADLEAMTSASIASWATRLMPPGSGCRYIVATSVDPASQTSGIGSRLVRWGTDKADKETGVYCWVQSSMGGRGFFEKQGFEEVGRLEVDLDEYSQGLSPPRTLGSHTETWGRYVWTYMRRSGQA